MSLPASASRRLPQAVSQSSRRCFSTSAAVSSAPTVYPTRPASQANTVIPNNVYEVTQQYPRHPLLAFFNRENRKLDEEGTGKGRDVMVPVSLMAESFESGADSGRAWLASELRTKSSLELHQLWYACLLERNKLATSMAEIQRAGALTYARFLPYKGRHVNKQTCITMARIRFVLNERRLALLDAQEKAASQTLYEEEELEQDTNLYEKAPKTEEVQS